MAVDPQVVKWAVAVLLFFVVLRFLLRRRRAGYLGAPSPLNANYTNTQNINTLEHSLSCVVGPGETSGYYSKGLTPGGFCGDQKLIREQMRGYRILDGVGGSLLQK
jgi:hypothetical protein